MCLRLKLPLTIDITNYDSESKGKSYDYLLLFITFISKEVRVLYKLGTNRELKEVLRVKLL